MYRRKDADVVEEQAVDVAANLVIRFAIIVCA
jgi:hypothetical protein